MANHHGTEGSVYVGANKIAEVNDFEFTEEAEFADDTPGDETQQTYHATAVKRATGTINCWWDETDTNGQEAIRAGNSVTINLRPEGLGTGKDNYGGTARITGMTISKPKGSGIVERRFTWVCSGGLTKSAQ